MHFRIFRILLILHSLVQLQSLMAFKTVNGRSFLRSVAVVESEKIQPRRSVSQPKYSTTDFMYLSEFDYGQRALYGEPCDLRAFSDLVRPIFDTALSQDDPKTEKTWVSMQQQYAAKMEKDPTKTLRAKTCQADHLMQCSTTKDSEGRNKCECLDIPPVFSQELDKQTLQCRAKAGARCYSPFGFYCLTGYACVQDPTGNCFCQQSKPNAQLEDSCQGLDLNV